MKEIAKINMNSNVRFKLTEYSEKINNSLEHPFKKDRDGYISTSLWEMAMYFGSHFNNGESVLFEENSIIVTDKNCTVKLL